MSRRERLANQKNEILLSTFKKYRKLTVSEMLELAEKYVLANTKPGHFLEKKARKMPINQRAFYALHNLQQWGDCKCR